MCRCRRELPGHRSACPDRPGHVRAPSWTRAYGAPGRPRAGNWTDNLHDETLPCRPQVPWPPRVSAGTPLPFRYLRCRRVSEASRRGISARTGFAHVLDRRAGAGMEVTEASVLMLPFAASSVGVARQRLVSDLIADGIGDSAVCDVALVFSELLSNALRHAGPLPGAQIRVAWRLDPDSVQVSVRDGGGQTQPELGQPTQAATGGRGLRIVEKLSQGWGTSRDDEGTTVWARVPVSRLTTDRTPAGLPVVARGSRQPGDLSRHLQACAHRSYLASRRAAG